jgi:hypothetical protein
VKAGPQLQLRRPLATHLGRGIEIVKPPGTYLHNVLPVLILQMEDIPSLSSGSVGSRFVSQNDLDEAKKKREEQWKAAYAR